MKPTDRVRSVGGKAALIERQPPAVMPPPPAQGAWERFLAWYLGWLASIFKPRR